MLLAPLPLAHQARGHVQVACEHRLTGVLVPIHFPQSPGAGLTFSLRRRALTPFAWLRASRGARSRAPGCVAARPLYGRTPGLLPVTCAGPWCGARGAGRGSGSRHDARERAGPRLRHHHRAVVGPFEAAASGERPCTAPAPRALRVRDTRRGFDAGGPWNAAYPTYPVGSRRIPLTPTYPTHPTHPAYPVGSRRIPLIPLNPTQSRRIPPE